MTGFFSQRTEVARREGSRADFFKGYLNRDLLSLHVGCTDWPIMDTSTSLHLGLLADGYRIDGYDVDTDGIAAMREMAPESRFFDRWEDIPSEHYHLVLVPEVIEHVPDVGRFLSDLAGLSFDGLILTAPNAFSPGLKAATYLHDGAFYEEVHPDHNCWYSPYTLANVVRKYTPWRITEVLLLEEQSMACVVALSVTIG